MTTVLLLFLAYPMLANSAIIPELADNVIAQIYQRDLNVSDNKRNIDDIAKPLNPDEFQEAEKMQFDEPVFKGGKDPLEGDKFEGDIILEDKLNFKNGLISKSSRWPGGIIPYTISFSFGGDERKIIAHAMNVYATKTCIQFVPKEAQHAHWIVIRSGGGCSSLVGRGSSGGQPLNLGYGCVYTGIVQHELMHAAGFWHEQSRHDRDDYVEINISNVKSGREGNFDKVLESQTETYGQKYDYGSVMHYGRTAFARNPSIPTITPIKEGVTIGQRHGLSSVDLAKLNAMYKCNSKEVTTQAPVVTKTPTGSKVCKDTHESCSGWAKRSECEKNPVWMKKHCPVSCNSCEGRISRPCKDAYDECYRWSKDGFCKKQKFQNFMEKLCVKSCNFC